MITIEKVEKYLKANGKEGGYLLKDTGFGNFVAKWSHLPDLAIPDEDILSVYDDEVAADKSMAQWKFEMKSYDSGMPRYAEDIISAMDAPDRAKIASETMDKYDAKRALRLTKPV